MLTQKTAQDNMLEKAYQIGQKLAYAEKLAATQKNNKVTKATKTPTVAKDTKAPKAQTPKTDHGKMLKGDKSEILESAVERKGRQIASRAAKRIGERAYASASQKALGTALKGLAPALPYTGYAVDIASGDFKGLANKFSPLLTKKDNIYDLVGDAVTMFTNPLEAGPAGLRNLQRSMRGAKKRGKAIAAAASKGNKEELQTLINLDPRFR